ncbi:hypothetical protein HAX54_038327 [Datura stramonium]|uniref:Uncharacterized protein n=1 Tax=Datura stramonium TaxID=4076 RepID=A0ABS8SHV6_DATST|nr:hypothetical protein [Datura stramonium]
MHTQEPRRAVRFINEGRGNLFNISFLFQFSCCSFHWNQLCRVQPECSILATDVETGSEIVRPENSDEIPGSAPAAILILHTRNIYSDITFSSDSMKLLATRYLGSISHDQTLKLWDLSELLLDSLDAIQNDSTAEDGDSDSDGMDIDDSIPKSSRGTSGLLLVFLFGKSNSLGAKERTQLGAKIAAIQTISLRVYNLISEQLLERRAIQTTVVQQS